MKNWMIIMALMSLFLVAGCGGDSDTAENAAEKATEEVQVATHDCDGGCGMKDVPKDQLTEIDGKFYCAGCAKKVQEDDHSGHNH